MDYKAYAMIMKALGDETRVKIFDMLSEGERCACNCWMNSQSPSPPCPIT